MRETLIIITQEPLKKGKGNRDGLVQQIVTYIKDGKTVTRKQWVRSEFADHARKNEEEKKKTLLEEQEREEASRARKLAEANEKARNQDKRAHKKVVARKEELEEKVNASTSTHGVGKHHISEYKKRLKKLKKQEEEQKLKQDKKNKTHSKKEEKKNTAFGQAESARKQNKEEENLITRPNT